MPLPNTSFLYGFVYQSKISGTNIVWKLTVNLNNKDVLQSVATENKKW